MNYRILFLVLMFVSGQNLKANQVPRPLTIFHGFVTQLHCKGRLHLSSTGNSKIMSVQAIPKDLGCGVIITPEVESGTTDLLIKTSAGDWHQIIEIKKPPLESNHIPLPSQLEVWIDRDSTQEGKP